MNRQLLIAQATQLDPILLGLCIQPGRENMKAMKVLGSNPTRIKIISANGPMKRYRETV